MFEGYRISEGKVYNSDGHVAVLVSPGHGAGWSTWNLQHEDCMFHPAFVMWVLRGSKDDEVPDPVEIFGEDFYYSPISFDLEVAWLLPGEKFYIDEYESSEFIVTEADIQWRVA